jgi:large subunit ribosomal protein L10
MNREEKAAVIEEVAGAIGAADAIFAVDYRGITVSQVKDLRVKLQDSNTQLRVVKNSLTERAADQAGAADLKSLLEGPTALAFVEGDAAAAAKVLSDTARALRGPLAFKGGYMSGALLSPDDVQSIARLPSREVLNAQLVGAIASPLSGLVRTLNALISGLAIQLGQIAERGLVGGGAPAPAEEAPAEEAPAAEAPAEEAPAAEAPAEEAPAETAEEVATDEPVAASDDA